MSFDNLLFTEVAFLWDFPSHEKKSQSHGKKIPWNFLKKSGMKTTKKSHGIQKSWDFRELQSMFRCVVFQNAFSRPDFLRFSTMLYRLADCGIPLEIPIPKIPGFWIWDLGSQKNPIPKLPLVGDRPASISTNRPRRQSCPTFSGSRLE